MKEEDFLKILEQMGNAGSYSNFRSMNSDLPEEMNNAIKGFYDKNKTDDGKIGWGGKISQGVTGAVGAMIKAGTMPNYYPDLKVGFQDALDVFTNANGTIKDFGDIGKSVLGGLMNQMVGYYQEQNKLQQDVNTKTGLTGELSKDFRREITETAPRLAQIGVSFNDISESMVGLLQQSGKFNLINGETLIQAGEVGEAYVGSLKDVTDSYLAFEKVGYGAVSANEALEEAGHRSLNLGLSSQKVTKEMIGSLDKLNLYGFKNGVQGLERMVQKATEFRFSLNETFKVAEKVWDPEGALELAANLQVLGGGFGDLNDPIRLMYMATNNVEGLQDAIIGASANLATYNEETGQFQVMGINLRRAKEEAKALGVDMSELTNAAIAAQERMSASSMLSSMDITDENKEFLTNLARMKGGKMSIDLVNKEMQEAFGATTLALDELSEKDAERLLLYQDQFKKMSTDEILRQQVNSMTNMERDLNFITTLARIKAGPLGEKVALNVGFNPEAMAKQSKELTGTVSTFLTEQIKEGNKLVDILGEKMKGDKTTEKQTQANKTVTGTHQVNVNITSDNKTDTIRRGQSIEQIAYEMGKQWAKTN